ncbi:hypothetical protein BH20ACT2_BH20ACT2_17970 [soil metagenome]
MAVTGTMLLAACGLFGSSPPRGAEAAPFLINEVPAGLERLPERIGSSGPISEDRLLDLGFSRDQAKLFDEADAYGYIQKWSSDEPGYVWAMVFVLDSPAGAADFAAAFVADAIDKGATPLVLPAFEAATGYRFELVSGFNLAVITEEAKVFALADNDRVGGPDLLAQLAAAQSARASLPPDELGFVSGGGDEGGGGASGVAAVLAAVLIGGVAAAALRVRRQEGAW